MLFKSLITLLLTPFLLLGWIKSPGSLSSDKLSPNIKTEVATSTKASEDLVIVEVVEPKIKKTPEKVAEKVKSVTKEDKSPKTPTSTPVLIPKPIADFEAVNTFARTATVNILCTVKGQEFSPASGTGVMVSPKGIILTNAHVGQYFLIKDFLQKDRVECVARNGSPAYPRYNLELVYISPKWVADNKSILKQDTPKGTGENDFAFLRITKAIDGSKLPESFPFVTSNISEYIAIGEPVVLVGYPAGFLGGLSILQSLNITSSITSVQDYFTFKKDTIDVISVPGTVVSQRGASGGAVVDGQRSLLGIITTSSDSTQTSARDLRAITLSYINRDLQSEIGITLDQFLNTDLADFAQNFQKVTAPPLTKLITDELLKN